MGIGDMISKLFGNQGKTDTERDEIMDFPDSEGQSDTAWESSKTEDIYKLETKTIEEVMDKETQNKDYDATSAPEAGVKSRASGVHEQVDDVESASGNVTEERVLESLSDVYDPEIPIDIVNLGLIYGLDIEGRKVKVRMTMTSPGCPASTQIVNESKMLIEEIPGVEEVDIDVVWDPPWDPSKMSEEAKESLGMF